VPTRSDASEQTAARLERLQTLHPKVIDLSLGRIERLLHAIGHPERALPPVIRIAGTNGKGSVTAFMRSILECAGLTVHVYTSPHLVRFNERIRLAGRLIGDQALCDILEECERVNQEQPITFFEATTAAALLAFSRTPADVLLLETGLGGRLDATSVVNQPAVTVLTPISLDHQQFLGNDIVGIATEKAGILASGAPAIVARQTDKVDTVIAAEAKRIGVSVLQEEAAWHADSCGDRMVFRDSEGTLDLPLPALEGPHQIQNAGTAIAALRALPGFSISAEAFSRGLAAVQWPARLQRLDQGPLMRMLPSAAELWLDGGHNPSAGEALTAALSALTPPRPVYLIMGMIRTKDAGAFLAPLAGGIAGVYPVPIPGEPGSLSPDDLMAIANDLGIPAVPCDLVGDALAAIAHLCAPTQPRVVICGSLYLAGRVLRDNEMSAILE
jgi:dihydrofolate synthase / folylpolyglutamate synthase